MNRKHQILIVTSITLSILFGVPLFTSTEYSILQLQKFFSVPGTEFVIGNAIVSKPTNWLLSTSRKQANGDVTFFGLVPEWMTSKNTKAPTEPYYSFVILNEYKVISRIDFIETPVIQNEKLTAIIQSIKKDNASESQSDPRRKLLKVKQWDALSVEEVEPNGTLFIYVPELKLTIRLAEPSLLGSIDIISRAK